MTEEQRMFQLNLSKYMFGFLKDLYYKTKKKKKKTGMMEQYTYSERIVIKTKIKVTNY